ncbi:MAG: flagellar hook-associated protein FlgK [Desulfobacterales bacterium]|nr:flagellar hook-associated protein FlgK [Desulfobacterales bacterium]
MSGSYGLTLNTAKQALFVQQKAISVTGHNLANVNTPGFSRQRLNISASMPLTIKPGQMGSGVQANEVQRVYDRFIIKQMNQEMQNLGGWDAERGALERVEVVFNEAEGFGLNEVMTKFWDSWNDLTNNPESATARQVVLSKGVDVAMTFNSMDADLHQIQRDIDDSIAGTAEDVNPLLEQIVDLNIKISAIESGGIHNANDYRDQRDTIVKQVAEYLDINTFENEFGQLSVMTGRGQPLVVNADSWELSTEIDPATGLSNVMWGDQDGDATDITAGITDGKLGGWIRARDEKIPGYMADLDEFAETLITELNLLHSTGFGLDDSTLNDFFNGTTAGTISVNPAITGDVNMIAASSAAVGPGAPGDNSNAVAIAELQNALTMNGGTASFDDFYSGFVSDMGNDLQNASVQFENQTDKLKLVENQRESISGVSVDEEMLNLIKYQHAYQAAAKLIAATDEMLNSLVSIL